jgi:serine protease Do
MNLHRTISAFTLLCAFVVAAGASGQDSGDGSLAAQEEAAIRAAVDHVAPSVVQIRTIGGLDAIDRTLLPDGPTTGLVISPDGWIVSSAFNFVQQPASILVTFADGEQAPAELVAKDHSRKLVLLKAQGVSGLAVPEMAPEDEIQVGEWAIAVGRTFQSQRPNISVGIVSARGRMFGRAIQTDADVSTASYGGPLVDIRGRVLGVLVPMSPQDTSEVAGAEWYDSGIGFAVPLAGISRSIEAMKKGEDQHSGVLGIAMENENAHESPATLATVMPTSPAGKAGFQKGDRVIDIDGQPIETQTDLRFALGTRYAGEEIRVTVKRGDESIERSLGLVGELAPFRHAFLGILPVRPVAKAVAAENDKKAAADASAGVAVRAIYPGSPAEGAGVKAGDLLVSIDGTKINSIADAVKAMNGVLPEANVAVRVMRGGKPLELTLTAAGLPTIVLNDLIPAETPADLEADEPEIKLAELKLAEFPQTCRVYVPPTAAEGESLGVLIWLHAPGAAPSEALFQEWRSICDRDRLMLVVPAAKDVSRWDRTELEYLRKLTERVLAEYPVDHNRVVVFGQEGGGAMAYLLALVSRDLFTGVATSAAALPRTIDPPSAQPSTRLAVFASLPNHDSRRAQAQQGLKKLSDAGYPVTTVSGASPKGELTSDESDFFARWIDALDRF